MLYAVSTIQSALEQSEKDYKALGELDSTVSYFYCGKLTAAQLTSYEAKLKEIQAVQYKFSMVLPNYSLLSKLIAA